MLGYHLVEIMYVDTANSGELFEGFSPIEKSDAEKLFKDFFTGICRHYGGRLHNWDGDGGFAFFLTSRGVGNAAAAGMEFIRKLPWQNAQTARALNRDTFRRRVRLVGHQCQMYLASDKDVDSADRKQFDHFIKYVKNLAPNNDHFFITETLYSILRKEQKDVFELFKKLAVAGKIRTPLYRLKREPLPNSEERFKQNKNRNYLSAEDWGYLQQQIRCHFINVSARNLITKGLTQYINRKENNRKRRISGNVILELTLDSLFGYLRVAFEQHSFCISYWRLIKWHGKKMLKRISFRYPDNQKAKPKTRMFSCDDRRYKMVECFLNMEPVVTPSVPASRLRKTWIDFDAGQKKDHRSLMSALQIPIYWVRQDLTEEPLGVLSLDSDQPDVFAAQEVPLWRDELVGYLANISLAESMQR